MTVAPVPIERRVHRRFSVFSNAIAIVKKLLESDYPGPEAPALRPIHGFANAIPKAFSGGAYGL